ncbi:MAG: BON domain-containing protein [Burkholderiaceae bacterium]
MKTLYIARLVMFSAALLMIVPGCTSISQEQSVGDYVADSVVTSRVKAALLENPGVSGYEIEVETYRRIVQLSGFVKSHTERLAAIRLAKATKGVTEVRDAIIVKR